MTCPQCQRSASPDAKFCTECGTRLIVRCPACGVDNAPGSNFCKECGQATFVYEEGCKKCLSCGFNEC